MTTITHIRKNYQITLPAPIRKRLHCKIGDIIELIAKDNFIILKPKALIDKEQEWFWTEEWQKGEREAQEDIEKGRIKKSKGVDELIKNLDK